MLSIIVPARNGHDFTSSCLRSLLHSVTRLNLACEFILIDDASPPEERILEAFHQHRRNAARHTTKIVRSRKHQHYTGAFSIGLHLATRDIIFFVSNDMYVTPTFLEALLLVSALSPAFAIVRGTSNHCDSHPEHQVMLPRPIETYGDIERFSRELFSSNACRFAEDKVLSGDAVLLKRALLERIGVLDLRFFGYFGDIDYGLRARLAGFKLVCAKGAWLYHEGGGHVKREMALSGSGIEEQYARRMAMVGSAYQAFRRKWAIESPVDFTGLSSLDFYDAVRPHAARVGLRYDFPSAVLDDLEFY